jgi:phosphomannomutase
MNIVIITIITSIFHNYLLLDGISHNCTTQKKKRSISCTTTFQQVSLFPVTEAFAFQFYLKRSATVNLRSSLASWYNILQKSSGISIEISSKHMSAGRSVDNEGKASCIDAAKEWIRYDPNPSTVGYVQGLIDSHDFEQLKSLFPISSTESTSLDSGVDEKRRIAFGTAGLRGKMLPGPLYMNDLVVIQTAQGIASYCKNLLNEKLEDHKDSSESKNSSSAKRQRTSDETESRTSTEKERLGVVIGYDHRATTSKFNISSLQFALYTTLVFQQAGFDDVFLLDGFVATPIVPFVLGQLSSYTKADYKKEADSSSTGRNTMMIGIMITASHNPKDDAGYKIYWSDGCQIRSPIDKFISTHIEQNLTPWVDYAAQLSKCKSSCDPHDPCCGLSSPERTKNETIPAYYEAVVSSGLVTGQVLKWNTNDVAFAGTKPPSFCYTALHGVGYTFAKHVLSTICSIPMFYSVPEQQEADPNFPTVQFPNPEEKGALDMAKAHAVWHNCDIILANDPDADRLAVAERDRTTGVWTDFTGDQIGAMLGHWLWQNYKNDNSSKYPNTVAAMCASTVSSRLLAEMARVEGFHYEDTLTGFKWIGSRAAELHKSPVKDDPSKTYHTIFCYEEAIGFCCGNVIFDKDGISALGVFAELSYAIYQRNMNLSQYMQSLYDNYGEFVSNNGYYFVSDPKIVLSILDNITNHGKLDTLDMVGSYKVKSVRYLGVPGYDSSTSDLQPTLPCSKSSPMITIRFENGCIAQFRGSGTEPKLKYYIELQGQPGKSRHDVADELSTMSTVILQLLLEPEKNGLKQTKC